MTTTNILFFASGFCLGTGVTATSLAIADYLARRRAIENQFRKLEPKTFKQHVADGEGRN